LHIAMLEHVYRRSHEFDLIHFHLDYFPFSLFSRQATPFVTTLHGRLDLPELQPVFKTFSSLPLVSISDSQRRPVPDARWIRTIHHGMPEHLLTPISAEPTYLAFLGRISPEKRVDRAVAIAARCGLPLKIAAKVDPADRDYFEEQIRPLLAAKNVEFIGEISDVEKPAFLSGAIGLIVPIDWPEPFGIVMIEAMACGTPVIAYRHGAVPEVLDNGVTGFVVADLEDAVTAAGWVASLDRVRVRHVFETRFTAVRMARDYAAVYQGLLEGRSGASIAAA
ncbi:MAG TPA: glycosyltransferase family 4 protein, partial [Rhizomicrobium sp.]|nr:glycosyltransferase family 4 protein [Rhizomicrobium sp.]